MQRSEKAPRVVGNRKSSEEAVLNKLVAGYEALTRARETAMVISQDFPELKLEQWSLIRECTPPTWREDIMNRSDPADMKTCAEHLEKAFSQFFVPSPDHLDRHDIIVCHGNVIRYFVTKVLGVDTMSWLGMSIGNCSLTVVSIRSDGAMKLLSFNDMGHIPANLQTVTGWENEAKQLTIPVK